MLDDPMKHSRRLRSDPISISISILTLWHRVLNTRQGLVKDTVVLRRLVRQVMPEQILALSVKRSELEKT